MFHSVNPSFFGRPLGVISGSRSLRSTVSELRGVCLSLMGRTPRAFVDAHRALSDLSVRLSGYFDSHESAEHFKAIAEECPSLRARADTVEQGHEDLKESVTLLRDLVRHANASRLARRIGRVLDRLEQHEHAESELLQEFFLRAGERTNREVRQ